MQALIISGGINTWWYESGGAQDLLIEDNTFGDSAYGGYHWPVISISGKKDNKGRMLGKIIINNNMFNNFNPSVLKATGVKHLEFTNNTINNSKTFTPIVSSAYVIDVKQVETLKIVNVEISDDFKNKLDIEDVKDNLSDINKYISNPK